MDSTKAENTKIPGEGVAAAGYSLVSWACGWPQLTPPGQWTGKNIYKDKYYTPLQG